MGSFSQAEIDGANRSGAAANAYCQKRIVVHARAMWRRQGSADTGKVGIGVGIDIEMTCRIPSIPIWHQCQTCHSTRLSQYHSLTFDWIFENVAHGDCIARRSRQWWRFVYLDSHRVWRTMTSRRRLARCAFVSRRHTWSKSKKIKWKRERRRWRLFTRAYLASKLSRRNRLAIASWVRVFSLWVNNRCLA